MFFLFLESLSIYGNVKADILVYTSTPFMHRIKQSSLFHENIKFAINDTYDTIDKACKARLDLFQLPISQYDTILYLDTDILVKDDIQKVFDVCKEDILYVLEEGTIDHEHHGNILFGEEEYEDRTAFTSGILLFHNCEKIKDLFQKIKEDIVTRPFYFVCHDQPYIVYNAFKYKLYDNKLLKSLVVNNDMNIHSDKVIHHFPGGPGVYQHKIDAMEAFLNNLKIVSLLSNTLSIEHDIWTCSSQMRYDIYDFFKEKTHYKIAEIGSHKGYTTKVLSKIFSQVYAVDNNVEWTDFNKNFNKDATNIHYKLLDIYNDTWDLPDDIDVAFIDAVHSYDACKSDILHSIQTFKNLKYIIFDDYGVWPGVKQIIDECINNKVLLFERFIGITDVPGPNGIVKNVKEGVICRVPSNVFNKTYTWENSSIKFLDNFEMEAFGKGAFKIVDEQIIVAFFGGREHCITFNKDYTLFTSVRKDDLDIVTGSLKKGIL